MSNEFVMVPRVPTPAMLVAAKKSGVIDPRVSGYCYELMVEAAPKHQGEPVAWMYTRPEVEWPAFYDKRKDAAGWKETPLYTHADPGEVERLRSMFDQTDADLRSVTAERDTLRAQLDDLRGMLRMAWGSDDISAKDCRRIDAALSASAEPSADHSVEADKMVGRDERAAFEKYYRDANEIALLGHYEGEYFSHDTQSQWETWQARAALERKI